MSYTRFNSGKKQDPPLISDTGGKSYLLKGEEKVHEIIFLFEGRGNSGEYGLGRENDLLRDGSRQGRRKDDGNCTTVFMTELVVSRRHRTE